MFAGVGIHLRFAEGFYFFHRVFIGIRCVTERLTHIKLSCVVVISFLCLVGVTSCDSHTSTLVFMIFKGVYLVLITRHGV